MNGSAADNLDLVLLKLDEFGQVSSERRPSLGSAADVQQQIRSGLAPGVTLPFNAAGDGHYRAARHGVHFSVGSGEAVTEVAVKISGRRADAFRDLRAICEATGWTLYDRATGRLMDVSLPDPTRPRTAAAPPFDWWLRLPSPVRIVIGLAIAWIIFYSLMARWVASWFGTY